MHACNSGCFLLLTECYKKKYTLCTYVFMCNISYVWEALYIMGAKDLDSAVGAVHICMCVCVRVYVHALVCEH